MPGIDTDELLTLALRLADRAGALVLEALDAAHAGVDTKTSGTDMVSDVDRASERLIVEALRAARPGDSVVGE